MAAVSQVQDSGLAEFVGALITQADVKHIGWGTGAAGLALSATNLTTPRTTEGRTSGTIASAQTTNTTGDTYRVTGTMTMTSAGPIAITEAGLFDASGSGTTDLRVYGSFDAINLFLNDSISFTINVVLNQA